MVDLRGAIAPTVDLRLKFGLANAALDGSTVLNVTQRVLGEVVNSVSDVLQLNAQQLRPALNSTAPSPTTTSPASPP